MDAGETKITEALASARDTRQVVIGRGVLQRAGEIFRGQFGERRALVVADSTTYDVAGHKIIQQFAHPHEPFIFSSANLHAEYSLVEKLERYFAQHDEAIPICVGSGTINDLTKLASHRVGRPYMCVATAASMDGYVAFGASITRDGAKDTFACPAPRAVVADLDIIAQAPPDLNAAGYADLLAKITAGADWILADALGVEPIHPRAWNLVQDNLRASISDPTGIRTSQIESIGKLVEGLILSGLAMQAAQSSRPGSGAEHQFSHLWDMQHHTHDGKVPLHGFKVGIGTLAVAELYEILLTKDLEKLVVDECCARWPDEGQIEQNVFKLFPDPQLREKALIETRAKHVSLDELRLQLSLLKNVWSSVRSRLSAQLMSHHELRNLLGNAGAPTEPDQIGISRDRLRESIRPAYHIRRRYTVLDLAVRIGVL